MAILDDVKILLGISDSSKDSVLDIYIRRAKTAIVNYLNDSAVNSDYAEANYGDAVVELVVKSYNIKNNVKDGVKQVMQGQRNIIYKDNTDAFAIDASVKSLLPLPKAKMR